MSVFKAVSALFFPPRETAPVVVLSPSGNLKNEADAVRGLFERGLSEYHLRRPRWNADKVAAWLRALPAEFRSRVVLHQCPELVKKFGLLGYHVSADAAFPADIPREKISVQCREYADLEKLGGACRCVMLGPVFPRADRDLTVPARTPAEFGAIAAYARGHGFSAPIFAFGGVAADNVRLCRRLGFDGVAAVGAVWESGSDPVSAYRALRRKW